MLVEALLESTDRNPDGLAVSDPRVRLSYRRLTAGATVLRDIIGRETRRPRVGILLPASSGFAAVLFGTLWDRKSAVPLNFLLRPAELARIVADAELDLILSTHYFDDLLGQMPARALCLEDLALKRRVLFSRLRRRPDPPDVSPEDVAVVLYTSGTDGDPKGVELTYANLRSNCDDCIATARMTPQHRFLNILPPFHVFGLTANVLAPVVLGASVHCLPRFQPATLVRAMAEEKPSIFMAIPTMYAALLRMKSVAEDTYAGLYLAVAGGEPLHHSIADGFRERFGVELLQGFGLTETSPVVSLNLPDGNRPGSVGRPIRNVRLRIVDERERDVAPGGDGEVWVQGPGVMRGYHHRPDATARALAEGGWFKTGDLGAIDAEGYLTITGRKKELIIVGGENVYPAEIESVLLDHPAVAEAAVVGRPDPGRGEVPVAFVVCSDGMTIDEAVLRRFVAERLAGYKVPRAIRIGADLPRGPTGKIHKRLLRNEL